MLKRAFICLGITILFFILGGIGVGLSAKYLLIDRMIKYETGLCEILECNATYHSCRCGRSYCTCYTSWLEFKLENSNYTQKVFVAENTGSYASLITRLCILSSENQNITCYYRLPEIELTLDVVKPEQTAAAGGAIAVIVFSFVVGISLFIIILLLCYVLL